LKQLHAARNALEAHLVRDLLASHGIAAEVRGEYLTGGMGELPLDVCSVWVHDDKELKRARELVNAVLSGNFAREASAQRWTCGQCGEALEGQFTACWQCGALKN
jgi:Putative prokaryotic signal transducing protein